MNTTTRRSRALVCAAALAAVAVAGCSSSAETTSATSTTAAPAGTTPAAASTGSGELCDAYVGVTAAIDSGEADPAEVETMLTTIESEAPDEIGAELETMVAGARTVIESGGEDTSAFETAAFTEAKGTVDPYLFENCEFDNKVEVSAKEYEFVGLPDTLEAGTTAILLTNDGAEAHEMALARKLPGVTDPWSALLELPEDEVLSKVAMAGQGFSPTKGSQTLIVTDLEPGAHLAVCFIPSGTTMDATGMHEGTGPPHMVSGMQQEFTVT